MEKNIFKFALLFILLAIYSGCSRVSIHVPVAKPAEINMHDYRNIIVGSITGHMGQEFNDELTEKLFKQKRFELFDKNGLGSLLVQINLSWPLPDDPIQLKKLGTVMDSTALVYGRISKHSYTEESGSRTFNHDDGTTEREFFADGKAYLEANLRVIDIKTGKFLAIKDFPSTKELEIHSKNRNDAVIDTMGLFKECRIEIMANFMKMIAPYFVDTRICFYKDGKIPELKKGIEYGKKKEWDKAIEQFDSAAKSHPDSWKTLFNLGNAFQAIKKYEWAVTSLEKAFSLCEKSIIREEIAKCKSRKSDYEEYKQQISTKMQ